MNAELIKTLVTAAPVLLSPIVAWALASSGVSYELARLDYLTKRLDLIEKLKTLRSETTKGEFGRLIEAELNNVDIFLGRRRDFLQAHTGAGESHQPKSWYGRIFLLSRSQSVRQRVFKGLFYLFAGFITFGSFGIVLTAVRGDKQWYYGLMGLLLWIGLALTFRRIAKPRSEG